MRDFDAMLERARTLDRNDRLAGFRDLFHVPEGMIYLDGNSLGLMPKACSSRLQDVACNEWAERAIGSWDASGWFRLPMTAGNRLAPIVGAREGEIAVGDSTSVNLFKCLAAALRLRPERSVIVCEANDFPTDRYIAGGLADMLPGCTVRDLGPEDDLADRLDEDVAVLMLSHVNYRTCEIRDVAATNAVAHGNGTLVLWDLSHTVGAVEIDLNGDDCDLAVGCTYKYLNGGPGAPAFTWVSPRIRDRLVQPLCGWMGHADPFALLPEYRPAPGARRLVCGTPQVLSLSALDEALKLWEGLDLPALFAKSRAITSFFIEAVELACLGHSLELACPRDPARRGSHVSLDFEHAGGAIRALAARRVIGDFRSPRTMRFGFAPLYTGFTDAARAAGHLGEVLEGREWNRTEFRCAGGVG